MGFFGKYTWVQREEENEKQESRIQVGIKTTENYSDNLYYTEL